MGTRHDTLHRVLRPCLDPLPESHPLCTMHINGDQATPQALQPHPQQAERARIITKRTLYTTVILACGFMW
jgi:hypothetical protein